MLSYERALLGAGGLKEEPVYVEDVFSTWLYTGNGSTQTITNGIDLAGEGGLVWIKARNFANAHTIFDTAQGATKYLNSASTAAAGTAADTLTAFTSSGFSLGIDQTIGTVNFSSSYNYASWTFRKAPGFFDVVTYTGNGSTQTINHNLGSAPGCMIVKRTDSNSHWVVYHRSIASIHNNLLLNTTDSLSGNAIYSPLPWGATAPTSTQFSVGYNGGVVDNFQTNISGATYVAYLFAHDEQIFGEGGDQSVVKCGSYTGTSTTTGPFVDLGWEPQWLLIKRATATGGWYIFDSMRGLVTGGADRYLRPNASSAEQEFDLCDINATGFTPKGQNSEVNSDNQFIYIAIRRGPMKTPESGTEVFYPDAVNANAGTSRATGFPVDWQILRNGRNLAVGNFAVTRLTGVSTTDSDTSAPFLRAYDTSAESNSALTRYWDNSGYKTTAASAATNAWFLNFRRAPGFFDVVAFLGNATSRTINHSLAVVPELMIFKCRDVAIGWGVYSAALAASENLVLQTDAAKASSATIWDNTRPTSTVFSVGSNSVSNANNGNMIAYLFATLPGISKVGSYTGTGTTLNIDCGFTSGARFVLIKRTDSTGDWYVWDTARGIVAANDPFLLLNSTSAENTSTDYIDPLSSGFQISSSAPAAINASGGSFIFLAVA